MKILAKLIFELIRLLFKSRNKIILENLTLRQQLAIQRRIIRKADDEGWRRCDVWDPGHLPSSNSEHYTYGRRVARDRHRNKGCNNLYLDWHVEWVAAESHFQ